MGINISHDVGSLHVPQEYCVKHKLSYNGFCVFCAHGDCAKTADIKETSVDVIDIVNKPAHYTFSKIEVIDAIEAWELPYHLGAAVKYIARAGRKDPAKKLEDLQKAVWYLNRYIEQEKKTK